MADLDSIPARQPSGKTGDVPCLDKLALFQTTDEETTMLEKPKEEVEEQDLDELDAELKDEDEEEEFGEDDDE